MLSKSLCSVRATVVGVGGLVSNSGAACSGGGVVVSDSRCGVVVSDSRCGAPVTVAGAGVPLCAACSCAIFACKQSYELVTRGNFGVTIKTSVVLQDRATENTNERKYLYGIGESESQKR